MSRRGADHSRAPRDGARADEVQEEDRPQAAVGEDTVTVDQDPDPGRGGEQEYPAAGRPAARDAAATAGGDTAADAVPADAVPADAVPGDGAPGAAGPAPGEPDPAGGAGSGPAGEPGTGVLPVPEPAGDVPPGGDLPPAGVAGVLLQDLLPAEPTTPARSRQTRRERWTELGGQTFGWLTVLPVLLVAAWLLPGLPLLLAGRFLPVPMFLIAAPVAAVLAVIAARYVPGRWPTPSGRTGPTSPWAAWSGVGGTAVIAAGFGVWQWLLASPELILLRQPGVLTQLGYWIAQHGELPIPTTAAAFGGGHPGLTFASYGLAAHGAAVSPWQLPGLPIVLAAGAWMHGLAGMTAVSPVLGAFTVLAVGGLTGRLAGVQWAPVGALAAALALPELLTSRSAYAEPLVELLLFGGLCLVTDSLAARPRAAAGRFTDVTRWRAVPPAAATMAALGGLALGLASLPQADALMLLLPVIPFAAVLVAGQRPRAAAFTAGMVAGVGYGLAGGLLLAGPGIQALGPSLRMIGLAVVWAAALTLAGVAAGSRDRFRRLLGQRPLRWLPEAAAVLVVAAAIAFAVRPYVQVVRGGGGGAGYVASLQQLAGQPADPRRVYAEDSFYWVIWYLGLPAALLAVAGLALLARRCARALITWRDPAGDVRTQTLPLLIIGWGALAVLWQPGTVPDQPWAGRILVPVVLPGLIVCAVWVAAWLVARARQRGAGTVAVALAAAFFSAAVAIPGAVTSFAAGTPASASTPASAGAAGPAGTHGPGLAVAGLSVDGPALQRTGAGEAAALRRLCGQIGQNSSVVLLDQTAASEFAPVLRGMCAIPAGVMVGASPGQVLAVAHSIARVGRRPVLLASRATALSPYLSPPRKVLDLLTRQDAHFLTRPPDGTWPVRYELWMSSPAAVAGA
ncbi:MAG: hypothetical protein ACM32E_01205 [Gemmatimonadota bacterium]